MKSNALYLDSDIVIVLNKMNCTSLLGVVVLGHMQSKSICTLFLELLLIEV
jgi:uncharacterized protein YejL (UPF0352 family)